MVTVGAQMSFDRLTRAVDAWAGAAARDDVFAQIGPTEFTPEHMRWTKFLEPNEFRAKVEQASLLVAHAGMGSIISALELGKPILVMPRRGDLRETRNDHQIATAKRFGDLGRVEVAHDEDELARKLASLDSMRGQQTISKWASDELIEGIKQFIQSPKRRGADS